ncbi:MAG TPA: MotA/TolQ/ExbB proton channel family protein [Arcobacter sp.]|nr:MotA/TolQ/ExbB proton channel family protein [Arcobacter sp.]
MIINNLVNDILTFLNTGGPVLIVLFYASIVFWAFVIEKFFYRNFVFKKLSKKLKKYWKNKKEKEGWEIEQMKTSQISALSLNLKKNLPLMKVIIAIFPLLGLLGTITGMVSVFDSMTIFGTNARAMAGGISMATIPTMAGMVLAVFGLFAYNIIRSVIDKDIRLLKDKLLKENDA